ncbi:hypothetical protein J3R30DRAFT_3303908 [Lentinula aciculospora]|uniref:Uncharacterized protein n=1 Tax=Lentinula aciculospora TaxID=153920 RepID=A0A9W8ZXU0_9AGAR|nr:hypothetical protein J3R30DRAFT_3303908 [Lentinula aciculospora]
MLSFATTLKNGWVNDPNDLRTSKAFAYFLASGIPGRERGSIPSQSSVLQVWKNLTAGWPFDNRGNIHPDAKTTIRNFIQGEVTEVFQLPLRKRVRRFATVPHFIRLGTQLWVRDWVSYGRPGDRVGLWAEIQLNVFTSARVGEYIESSARAGSGQGLHFRDVSFGILRNEYGDPEFTMQVVKDGKGMTFMPCRRPEHSLHEGLEERPLFCNPILTHLAIFIARKAFHDFKTIDKLLALKPSNDEEMFLLAWDPDLLDKPIYQRDRKIDSASTLTTRLRALGKRAGYAVPLTIHDFHAEALFLIGELVHLVFIFKFRSSVRTNRFYSPSARMRQAGHRDDCTYTEYYAPTNPGMDGQGSYFGGTRWTVINERFCDLTVAWNPKLYQSLPAQKMYELEQRDDFIGLEDQLFKLCLGGDDPDATEKRKKLQAQKRNLVTDELHCLQANQPRDITKDNSGPDGQIGHQRTMFQRICNLMGAQDHLANNLLATAPIWSPLGRQVLEDLISLCEEPSDVKFHPGLEPENCCCPPERKKNTPRSVVSPIYLVIVLC